MEKQKKAREDPFLHYEGDTDIEELYEEETRSECEDVAEPEYFKGKQIVVNPGPTSKAHHEPACKKNMDFRPSSDEDSSPGDLGDSDDDGFVPKHLFTSGRKSRSKKSKEMVWYDERRANPDDQLCKKMCFTDVYQYRRALRHLHVSQLRNFTYHRNNKDRVIAVCADDNCPFFMVGSQIKHENTFVLRKMNLQHECLAHGENTKVTIDWLAETSVGAMRTDFNTSVDTLIEQAKQKYGVVVPRSKAYRARTKALNIVLGDHETQYKRIRDYLQTVIDTNPGSRCIVTTKEVLNNPSQNPRFHGLFFCLNASKEGFLNGCRPFIGSNICSYIYLIITDLCYSI